MKRQMKGIALMIVVLYVVGAGAVIKYLTCIFYHCGHDPVCVESGMGRIQLWKCKRCGHFWHVDEMKGRK